MCSIIYYYMDIQIEKVLTEIGFSNKLLLYKLILVLSIKDILLCEYISAKELNLLIDATGRTRTADLLIMSQAI